MPFPSTRSTADTTARDRRSVRFAQAVIDQCLVGRAWYDLSGVARGPLSNCRSRGRDRGELHRGHIRHDHRDDYQRHDCQAVRPQQQGG